MTETVLLLGGGGREHAMARAVAASEIDNRLYGAASNLNPGIAALADGYETLDETDCNAVVEHARDIGATIVLVGPEAPLAAGVTDALDAAGIYAFAPTQSDARIETDKGWQRTFMRDEAIPGCPAFEQFSDAEAAATHIETADGHVAVKPAGLTGGKGVRVTGDQLSKSAAASYVRESEYDEWVVEERLVGEEFTVQAFVADGDVRLTPAIQDHKRAFEGDEGPNTGGMGSYSDVTRTLPFMTEEDFEAAADIIAATVDALPAYRGVLYGQFMLTASGPKVVEFNARFGDPEAMNTLSVMRTDFLRIAVAARDGDPLPEPAFAAKATVCKYAVPEGYPTDPKSGAKVAVDEETIDELRSTRLANGEDVILYYASVDRRDDGIYTTTSRSFAVVGIAESIQRAEEISEAALSAAGDGVRIRHDIGTEALVEQRVSHMRQLRE